MSCQSLCSPAPPTRVLCPQVVNPAWIFTARRGRAPLHTAVSLSNRSKTGERDGSVKAFLTCSRPDMGADQADGVGPLDVWGPGNAGGRAGQGHRTVTKGRTLAFAEGLAPAAGWWPLAWPAEAAPFRMEGRSFCKAGGVMLLGGDSMHPT